jgi:hypothetical protein
MLSSVIQEVIDGLLDIDILALGAAMIDDMMGAYVFTFLNSTEHIVMGTMVIAYRTCHESNH